MVLLTLTAYNNTQFTPSERPDPELSINWVDPLVGLRRVGSGWVEILHFLVG